MSKNQLHGKTYEDYIKSAFPGSADHGRPASAKWDIEDRYDKINHLSTSIKTSKGSSIELADARKIWQINEQYRIILGRYQQIGDVKDFYSLHEIIITKDEHSKLLGNIRLDEIESFHDTLLHFKKGSHDEARRYAKSQKLLLANRSIITLNPKIDTKSQRRLQCSIPINRLLLEIKNHLIYNIDDFFRGISVHFRMQSSEREINT